MIKISVRLFGALRQYGNGRDCEIQAHEGLSADDLREHVVNVLAKNAFEQDQLRSLLGDCALVCHEEMLPKAHFFQTDSQVALLPPVCGG